MMNRKGALVLRDVMFMMIIFAGLMGLMSVFVIDMATEYSNSQMVTDYNSGSKGGVGGIGSTMFGDINDSMQTMRSATESGTESSDSLLGSFTSVTGIIQGAAAILKQIVLAPVTIGNAVTTMFEVLTIPAILANIVGNIISFIIYALIIFVIVSALLKGGKV